MTSVPKGRKSRKARANYVHVEQPAKPVESRIVCTWNGPKPEVPAVSPVQFTPRQLAYLTALLLSEYEHERVRVPDDTDYLKVIHDTYEAARKQMRSWWDAVEGKTTSAWTVTTSTGATK